MIRIDRGYLPTGTFGDLFFGDDKIGHTVERAWANNKPNLSCIPEGDYIVEPYESPRFGKALIIHGGTVDKFAGGKGARWGVLFHVANFAHQLEGCIAPACTIGVLNGLTAGISSRVAMDRLLELVTEPTPLRITHKTATL